MIQRIQSVYFALAGVITLLLLVVNIAVFSVSTGYNVSLNALGISPADVIEKLSIDVKTLSLTITTIISGILSFVALFLYKKRSVQMRLARINIVLLGTIIAQNILISEDIYRKIEALEYEKNYFVGFSFPLVAIILTALALKGIKKDEDLVKSMDRIR